MRGFYTLFQAFILLVLIWNIAIFYVFGEDALNLPDTAKYSFMVSLVVIEFLIIIYIVNKFFFAPIKELELTIKNFLAWNLKNKDIALERSFNPHLNFILSFFVKTLNTLKNIKSEFIHGKEIKSEVELAKEIQGKMLTKKLTKVPSLDIIVKSKPAGEIGWDSYDIIQQWDNYYIYVGDATGHGVWAGFIMIMVNALISGFSKVYKSWNAILAKTNEVLKPRVKANLLMSLLMIRWDEQEKRMFMTWAWHEYLMIYKHEQRKCFRIKSGWVALGMIKDVTKLLKEQEIKFEPNDIIVLYSDGITEAINKPKKDGSEEMFLEDRLVQSIENAPNIKGKDYKSSRSVFNNITIELSKFMGYNPVQLDDVTLATVHYKWDNFDIANDFPANIPESFITEWNW